MNAALKFLPKDGDGDDGLDVVSEITITPCDNGYILKFYDDESEGLEVFVDKKELLKRIGTLL